MQLIRSLSKSNIFIFCFIIFCTFALRILQLSEYPIPQPLIQDEIANVFAAHTFAAGEITNPTPDIIRSLSVPHIIEHPSWMSKYPPVASVFMAMGIVFTGEAYWGVVFITALAIAAYYWAILGWVTKPTTAFIISFLLIFILKAPNYWINSYWGGSAALFASMLLLGAYPRIIFHHKIAFLWIALIGAMLGMMTRPYEMSLLTIFLTFIGIIRLFTRWKPNERQALWNYSYRLILPFILFIIANGYYNYSITGNIFKLPHVLYSEQYGIAPLFRFGDLQQKPFSDLAVIHSGQLFEIESFKQLLPYFYQLIIAVPSKFCALVCVDIEGKHVWLKNIQAVQWLIIIVLLPLLCMKLLFDKKYHDYRLELGIGLIVTWIASSLPTGLHPHYLAGMFALLIIACSVFSVRATAESGNARRYLLYGALIAFFLPTIAYGTMYYGMDRKYETHQAVMLEWLDQQPYQSLVFVNHDVEFQSRLVGEVWGNSTPFLEKEKVIWAHYLTAAENQKVIDHFPNRKIWYIEPFKEKKMKEYTTRNKELP